VFTALNVPASGALCHCNFKAFNTMFPPPEIDIRVVFRVTRGACSLISVYEVFTFPLVNGKYNSNSACRRSTWIVAHNASHLNFMSSHERCGFCKAQQQAAENFGAVKT